jgi:hypothetical protein
MNQRQIGPSPIASFNKLLISSKPGSVHGEKTKDSIEEKIIDTKFEGERESDTDKMNYGIADISDLIRATFIVDEFKHTAWILDLIKREFPDLIGSLPYYPDRGYRGIHLRTNCIDGLSADLHICTPVQCQINEVSHHLYKDINLCKKLERESVAGAELQAVKEFHDDLDEMSQLLYDFLWKDMRKDKSILLSETVVRSKIATLGSGSAKTDLKRVGKLDANFAQQIQQPSHIIKDGQMNIDTRIVSKHAALAQEFAKDRQRRLVNICNQIANEYEYNKRKGNLEVNITSEQKRIMYAFRNAILVRAMEYASSGIDEPYEAFLNNFTRDIAAIEKNYIFPKFKNKDNWQFITAEGGKNL